LGDAAHAIVPFYGQGMNAAFEDVRLLCNEIHHHAGLTFALDRFANLRKPDANAIAEMALENFIEMRDLPADPEFHYRKRLEQAAHDIDPASIRPQYNLVSFSRMRYSEVQMIGRQTARLVEALADRLPRAMARSMPEPQWRDRVAELLHRLLAAQAR
jgi:kynurenine 3-monooxygenase